MNPSKDLCSVLVTARAHDCEEILLPTFRPRGDAYSLELFSDRIPTKKEPCLTPTLMDEGQARNPNTTYNGYIMEFWKFA